MRYIVGFICFFLMGHGAFAKDYQQVVTTNCQTCPSWWQTGWAATAFGGSVSFRCVSSLLTKFEFGNTGIVGLAGAKKLGSVWQDQLDFEFEAQVAKHFGEQDHVEVNPLVIVARWKTFPWNCFMPTTVAVGDGLSVASSMPKGEKERRSKHSKVLNYVIAELTLAHPDYSQWAFVARWHHRSGMFGTFSGVHDASSAFVVGLKYWF